MRLFKILGLLMFFLNISFVSSIEIEVVFMDKDIEIPLEGVLLSVINSNQQQISDANGIVRISIQESQAQYIAIASLIGYETRRFILKNQSDTQTILLSIQGVLQGEELVIEGRANTNTDAQSGVSTIIDREEIKQTTKGPVEDIMTTIKTLPGVSYAGKFSSRPSIRGGHPSEMSAVLDGYLIRFPYYWGGAFSVFNPNIIDSIKFSNGIFSARYGMAVSGLLEINSLTPDQGFKFDQVLSTTTAELFLQIPLWQNSGLFMGGRVTYLDPVLMLAEKAVTSTGTQIETAPYIREANLKWFWKPHQRVEWYINSFFGSDGVGLGSSESNDDLSKTITSEFLLNYYKYDFFVMSGIKLLPHDRVYIHILAGYELLLDGYNASFTENGTKKYSNEFIDRYSEFQLINPLLPAIGTTYSVNNLKTSYTSYNIAHSFQHRIDVDISCNDYLLFSLGGGLLYDYINHVENGKVFTIIPTGSLPLYKRVSVDLSVNQNQVFNTFTYLNFKFNIIPSVLELETGIRIDHFYMQGIGVTLNTYPVANPRLMLSFTPVKNLEYLESIVLSLGVGLFSKIPIESSIIEERFGISDFDVQQPKTLTALTGIEINLPLDFKIKLEGYYKFYFHRFYFNTVVNSDNQTEFKVHSDGVGHAGGFDILIQRKVSRWIDGWLSYSFIFAKYFNPSTDNENDPRTFRGEPTGSWYYPSFHRWHNLNLVLNIKPVNWFTISFSMSFASGNPRNKLSSEMFPALLSDGSTVLEMYRTISKYHEIDGDSIRNGFSIPIDLAFRFHFYFPFTKIKFEAYIAAEDIIVMTYSANLNPPSIDKYTGREVTGQSASFNIGFPIPSIGIKVNF